MPANFGTPASENVSNSAAEPPTAAEEIAGLQDALALQAVIASEAEQEAAALERFVLQQVYQDPFDDEPEEIGQLPAPNSSREVGQRRPPQLISIRRTSVDTTPKSQSIDGEETSTELPRNMASQRFALGVGPALGGNEYVRHGINYFVWSSPASRHKPLYFEQPNLERYGSHFGGDGLASVQATACFVGSAVTLPYRIAAHPPRECVYTLGSYRPGGCNPHFVHLSPLSLRGLAAQGAAVAGGIAIFP